METNPNVAAAKKVPTSTIQKSKEKGGWIQHMLNVIKEARTMGATPDQLSHMRQYLYRSTNWHPTKKRVTKEQRRIKNKMQRYSRRVNYKRQKIYRTTKGSIKSGRV